MNYDITLINYFLNAGVVVKSVMIILIIASIFSWAYIFQRSLYLKGIKRAAHQFEKAFWSGEDLTMLYAGGAKHQDALSGLEAIFHAGFKEFQHIHKQANSSLDYIIDNTKRAMRATQMREAQKLETHLSFLAIVSSVSPYVGLFGTVWGIMQAFRALSNVQQATISMVAPGLAEALIATALGLFTAIPAVIFYNRLVTGIGHLMNRFDAFQEELINILVRQSQMQLTAAESERKG